MDILKKILHVIKVIYGVVFAIAGVVLIFAPKMPDNDTAVTILGAIFCLGIAAILLKPNKKEAPPAKPVQPTPEPVTSPISNNISSAQGYEAGEQCTMDKINGLSTNNSVYRVNSKVHSDDLDGLRRENARLREQLTPEQSELVDIKMDVQKLKAQNDKYLKEIAENEEKLNEVKCRIVETEGMDLEKVKNLYDKYLKQIEESEEKLNAVKQQITEVEDVVSLQSFGLYTPHYDFMRADDYKARLLEIRARQKDAVREGTAVSGSTAWAIDGDTKKGGRMVADMQKLLLRAFNAECDDVVEHVKYNNVEISERRITASREAISKLGAMMGISITSVYYGMKLDELHLAFEWQQKKQQEKEEQREARAEMKEAQRLARELEEERRKLEKEQTHYQNALAKINAQLAQATGDEAAAIEEKKAHIEQQLDKIDTAFKEVDYREANQRAGYVYIISNIGAFGENVYKIGMTRRLDPSDRVDELGDASVPFKFDIHAMIFSDDAPKLEAALHNAFADRKLNFVNQRREFFNVTLDEIKKVVKENFDKSVEFIDTPPAEQYRESLLLRAQANANT
jgi:hypothetical protein